MYFLYFLKSKNNMRLKDGYCKYLIQSYLPPKANQNIRKILMKLIIIIQKIHQ